MVSEYSVSKTSKHNSSNKNLYFIFMLTSINLWIITIFLYNQKVSFLERAVSSSAVVTKLERGDCYRAVFEFYSYRKKIVAPDHICSSPALYHIGEKVTILYDPKDPLNFVTNTFIGKWLEILMTLVFSLVFSISTIVIRQLAKNSSIKKLPTIEFTNARPISQNKIDNETFLLSTNHGDDIFSPTNEQLRQAIISITEHDDEFLVLKKGECFIQYAGAELDYRDEKSNFYTSVRNDFSTEEIVEILESYANEDLSWKEKYEWKV